MAVHLKADCLLWMFTMAWTSSTSSESHDKLNLQLPRISEYQNSQQQLVLDAASSGEVGGGGYAF